MMAIIASWFGEVQQSKLKCIDVAAVASSSLTVALADRYSLSRSFVKDARPKGISRANFGSIRERRALRNGSSKVEKGRFEFTIKPIARS